MRKPMSIHAIDIRKEADRICNLENNPGIRAFRECSGYAIAGAFEGRRRREIEEMARSMFYVLIKGCIPQLPAHDIPKITLFSRKCLPKALYHGTQLKAGRNDYEMDGWTWTDSAGVSVTADIYVRLRTEEDPGIRNVLAHVLAHEMSHREFILTGGSTRVERVFCSYVSEYYADFAGFRKMGLAKPEAVKLAGKEKEVLRPGIDGTISWEKHPSRNARISFAGRGTFDRTALCLIADEAISFTGNRITPEEKKKMVREADKAILSWQQSHPGENIYGTLSSQCSQ